MCRGPGTSFPCFRRYTSLWTDKMGLTDAMLRTPQTSIVHRAAAHGALENVCMLLVPRDRPGNTKTRHILEHADEAGMLQHTRMQRAADPPLTPCMVVQTHVHTPSLRVCAHCPC
ncbi:hypothetical protein EON66_08870 [archaeon]|nr:MAG: hypothetical protein EON66_08870 [archaeon]